MQREKDKQLSRVCTALADASLDALAWVNDNADAIGDRHPGLVREYRKASVEARKLALAAERPMSVAVFGASQAGKSYMVGGFISPRDNAAKAVFTAAGETQKFDFLEKINPQGGKETTGIVTRFSTQLMESPIKGFPVILRALSEGDIVKILANTHMFELKCGWEGGRMPDYATLAAAVSALPRQSAAPGMSIEDIYELRGYIEAHLDDHPLAKPEAEGYWTALERSGPFLAAPDRAKALGPCWGELPEFTNLYATLKSALDDLKHPKWMYAPLESVLDSSHGVLHAETLYALDPEYAAKLQGAGTQKLARTTLASDTGMRIDMPRPIVTALAAELRVTLDGRPWDFFEHTDLLDFPGAKSRMNMKPETFLRSGEHDNARAYCYLRGKVGVLFDKYVDDFETNALVLAVDDSQAEVKMLPQLVKEWVYRTHGETPAQRAQASHVSMFFTMTKCDSLFKLDRSSNASETVRNRVGQNIASYAGWMKDWAPGRSFDNMFMFRNTSVKQQIIEYVHDWPNGVNGFAEIPLEQGYAPEFVERRQAFKDAFQSVSDVQAHMAHAAERFDALLTLNDGGITYLAKALRPVCDLDLKFGQIEPIKNRLREKILNLLAPFHEASDVTRRIAERVAKVHEVVNALADNMEQFGPFIREYQISPMTVSRLYLDYTARRGPVARTQASPASGLGSALKGMLKKTAAPAAAVPETAAPGAPSGFGRFVLGIWREGLAARAKDDALAAGMGLSPEQVGTVMNEILGHAASTDLERLIDEAVSRVERMPRRPDEIAYRVGMATAKLINDCVGNMGHVDTASDAVPPRYPELPEDPAELNETRVGYFVRWIQQLETTTENNARGGQGGRFPPEENVRLGKIIERVRAV